MDVGPVPEGEALDRLRRIGGAELVVEMIDLFLENTPDRLAAARAGLRNRDLAAVQRAAHSLKSTAATLGAEPFRSTAETVEQRVREGEVADVSGLLEQLERQYQTARERLIVERARGGTGAEAPDDPGGAVE